jgi:hypothetical protein
MVEDFWLEEMSFGITETVEFCVYFPVSWNRRDMLHLMACNG